MLKMRTAGGVRASDFARSGDCSRNQLSVAHILQSSSVFPALRFLAMIRSKVLRASRPWTRAPRKYCAPPVVPQKRCYSIIQKQEEDISQLPDLNPKSLTITDSKTPKEIVPAEQLVFGRNFTGKLLAIVFLRRIQNLMTSTLQITCLQPNGPQHKAGYLLE